MIRNEIKNQLELLRYDVYEGATITRLHSCAVIYLSDKSSQILTSLRLLLIFHSSRKYSEILLAVDVSYDSITTSSTYKALSLLEVFFI